MDVVSTTVSAIEDIFPGQSKIYIKDKVSITACKS